MKKVLAVALVLGIASVANAGILRANFVGGGNIASGLSADIEVWYDSAPSEAVNAVGGGFEAIAGDPLAMTAYAGGAGTPQPVLGNLGPASSFGAFFTGGAEPVGQSLLIGTATISPTGAAVLGTEYAITFDAGTITILDPTGGSAVYDVDYAPFYAGYFDYGQYGAPDIKNKKGVVVTPGNPLLYTYTPEPASLALLAIGGIAVLRRR